jgi:hypothetical protein
MDNFSIDPSQSNPLIQTPEQAAYLAQLGKQLTQEGTSSAPIQSPWQGAAGLAKALLGGYDTRRAFGAENAGRASNASALATALGFGGPAAPTQLQGAAAPTPYGAAMPGAPPPTSPVAAALGAGAAVQPSASPSGPANNPGNLIDNSWTRTLPGYVGPHGGFASFDSPADGVAAMAQNLSSYARQGVSTLAGLTSKWAPAGDGANDPAAYAATLAHGLGVDPNAPINLADPSVQQRLIPLMARVEQGPGAPPVSFAGAGGPLAHAADGTPVQTNAQGMAIDPNTGRPVAMLPPSPVGAGASPLVGPQGAGVGLTSPTPAPSQADIAQLRAAMQPPAAPSTGFGLIGSAQAAPAGPQPMDPRLAQASALNAPMPAAAPPAGAPPAPAAPMPSPPMPSAPPAAAAPPAGVPPQAAGGFHPDAAALLRVLQNPWASPAQQQIAMALLQTQMPTPPQWGVIGKDVAGNEQYGWINPKTQTITPAGPMANTAPGGALPSAPNAAPAAPGAPGAPGVTSPNGSVPNVAGATANGMTPQGAAWLDGIEAQGGAQAQVARAARGIINGQAPLPEANAATKPIDIAIRDAVFKAAPSFNSSIAAAKAKAVVDFSDTSNPSSPGGLILNLNTALGHLGRLSDSSEKVGGFDTSIPGNDLANEVKNMLTTGPAATGLAAYRQDVQRFVEEATKFYQGSGGTEFDRDKAMEELDPSRSPSERRAAIAEMSQLMQTKATELQRKWGQATPGSAPFPVIGPEAQAAAARVAGRAPRAAGAPVTLNPANPDADYAALPSGAKFIGPDGHVRTKP